MRAVAGTGTSSTSRLAPSSLLLTVATRSSSAVRARFPPYRLPVALANLQSPDVHREILHTTALALPSAPDSLTYVITGSKNRP